MLPHAVIMKTEHATKKTSHRSFPGTAGDCPPEQRQRSTRRLPHSDCCQTLRRPSGTRLGTPLRSVTFRTSRQRGQLPACAMVTAISSENLKKFRLSPQRGRLPELAIARAISGGQFAHDITWRAASTQVDGLCLHGLVTFFYTG